VASIIISLKKLKEEGILSSLLERLWNLLQTQKMLVRDIRTSKNFKQEVLIVDDQQTILSIHAAIVKKANESARVTTMKNPKEALKWLKNKRVSLLILDYRMTQLNGLQFIKEFKKNKRGNETTIIVVTIIKDEAVHKALLDAGARMVLRKPAHIKDLTYTVGKILSEHKRNYNASGLLN
jgi:DNA-binding response OmpR family regulator